MKRGQAAMEFLMTYGWALLVVLVAIAALAFFGVLNPSKFLPNSCSLAPGFSCVDFKASASGNNIQIILQNGLGDQITAVTMSLASISGGGSCITQQQFTPASTTIGDGGQMTFNLGCTGMGKGQKLKGDLTLTYTLQASGITHSKVGQLVTGIEA